MDLQLDLDGVLVAGTADDEGLRVRVGERSYDAPWDEVVAGYVTDGAPGAGSRGPTQGLLLLARGPGPDRSDELVVPLPGDRQDVAAFVAEVRRRAGEGWVGEGDDHPELAGRVFQPGAAAEAATPPWGLAIIAFVIAGIVAWQLVEAGHVGSPLTAVVVALVLGVVFLLLVRLRTRR